MLFLVCVFCSFFFSYHCKLLRQSEKETRSENILSLCPSEPLLNIKTQLMKTNQQGYHVFPCTPRKRQELGQMSWDVHLNCTAGHQRVAGRSGRGRQQQSRVQQGARLHLGAALPLASPRPTCSAFPENAQLGSNTHTPQRAFN